MVGSQRVLVVGLNYWPEPSGNAPYTTFLSRALAQKHNLKVITGYPHYPWWKVPVGWEGNKAISTDGSFEIVRYRPWLPRSQSNVERARLEAWFGLRAALTSWRRPEVILLVSPAMLSSAIAMAKAKMFSPRAKTIVWVQDIYTLGLQETQEGQGLSTRFIASVEKWLLKSADRVVVIHDRFRDAAVREFSLEPSRVSVVRNWSQFRFQPSESLKQTRRRLGWADDETVILHTGNIGVKQGLDSLVLMARTLEQARPKFKIVLLGDGNQRSSLMDLAQGIQNIVFIDPVDEVELSNMLQAADIALVHEKSGVSEMAVPSKLTTYFSAAKPVLAVTDPGSITDEEVRNSGAGIAVASGNQVAFCEAVDALLQRKQVFARHAQDYASAKLGGDVAVASFERIMSDLIQKREKSK